MLPVPLNSPPKNAVAGSGGFPPPPACRITHGAHDSYFENLVGKRVASIRRGLATVFSISTDAEAFIGGQSMASIGSGRANDWFIRELAGVESIGAGVSSSAARALGSRKASRHRK